MASLYWPDYLIIASFIVSSLAIGVYHAVTGGRQRTTSEFLMADRQLSVLPTVLSLLMSFTSAIAIVGLTAEMYQYGVQYMIWSSVGYPIGMLVTSFVVVPWLYPLQMTSINEYLELRFKSRSVRLFGSLLMILSGVIYMGTAMYAPSLALQVVTGLPINLTIPTMAIVCTIYTALGGMRAVIWTDVIQFLVTVFGMLTIVIQGVVKVGGVGKVWQHCAKHDRLIWANWSPDPTVRHTVWGFVFGWSTYWLNFYGFSQAAMQRYAATKTVSSAKSTVVWSTLFKVVFSCICCATGLVVFAYYTGIGCDPIAAGQIHNGNQILPHFVTQVFGQSPGFSGLFLIMLYSAALSSVSSSLSGLSANTWEDILKQTLPKMSEQRAALLNKILVVGYGLLAIGVSMFVSTLHGPLPQVVSRLISVASSPVMGMFLLGGCFRSVEWRGALIGGVVSLALNMWIMIGSISAPKWPTLPPTLTDNCTNMANATTGSRHVELSHGLELFYSISYMWYPFIGMVTSLVVGLLASNVFNVSCKSAEVIEIEDRYFIRLRHCLFASSEYHVASTDDQVLKPLRNTTISKCNDHVKSNDTKVK